MRFLLLNQFFPPDSAPTGRMLRDLAHMLVSRGHEVRVICSRLGYDGSTEWDRFDASGGVQVVRTGGTRFRRNTVLGRLAAYATFAVGALRAATVGPVPDTVVSLTTPPFLGIVGAFVATRRGSRHAHWVMDVYPDALLAHWRAAGNPLLRAGLEWLGRAQFRGVALVVAPGARVEERLRRYVPVSAVLRSVPLWATESADTLKRIEVLHERTARGWSTRDVVLMYSGNMGLGHRFDEFLTAAGRLGVAGPIWAFVGGGPRRAEIERFRAQDTAARIELLPSVDGRRLAESLASADVQLVSVAPGWEGVMVPSKLQNAFSVGCPVIFLGPAATEAATWIRESGGGWVVPPGDVDALIRVIAEATDPAERSRRGQGALEYARIHFNRDRNCGQIADLLLAYASSPKEP